MKTHKSSTLARRSRAWFGAAAASLVMTLGAGAAQAGDWSWTVTPYGWLTDVGVDVEIHDRQVVDEKIPVSDLVEILDTIVQMRLEVQYRAYGLSLDVFDVTMSDEVKGLALPQGAGTADLDADMGMTIVDVAGFYDPNGDRQGVSFLYGTRILNERSTIDAAIRPTAGTSFDKEYEVSETYVDALLGVRFTKRFSRHWSWHMQADLSMGGTDFTWSTNPSLAYAFGETGRYALTAGYRHMHVDFVDEHGVDPEMSLSGALVGLRLSF